MIVIPPTAVDKLGFGVVRARLEEHLVSPLGAEAMASSVPSSDLEAVRRELAAVWELQQILRFDDPLPLRHVLDVRALVRRAMPEDSFLEPEELSAIRLVLETIRLLGTYLRRRSDRFPAVAEKALAATPLPGVEEAINRVIDDQGNLRDDASPELRRLRNAIQRTQADLRSTLQKALRDASSQGYATEEQPTIRGGRMVIPIRAEA